MKRNCCTCLARIDDENASVLTMGAYGTPKCLCEECGALVETMTAGREYDEITKAMESLTERMSKSNIDDRFTVNTVTRLLSDCAERAQKIKEGTYDFSLDETEDEGFDDIPEELMETEEDRLLDEKDAEANRKFDKFMNWTWVGVGIGVLLFVIWKVVESFL